MQQREGSKQAGLLIHVRMLGLLLLLAGLLAFAFPAAKEAQAIDSEEQNLVTLINNYRAANGLSALSVSMTLTNAAEWMSQDMANLNYFSHTDSLGRNPFQRMADFGYNYNTGTGETLAAGAEDAQTVLNLWINSPGHNAILLNANFHAIGMGRAFGPGSNYGWYWTADFGGFADAPPPPPTPSTGAHVLGGRDVDCNSRVDIGDAMAILRYAASVLPTANCIQEGDANCDASINLSDALLILRFIAGIPNHSTDPCP
ncbi:MAG TPA: CAP domain-containing protein [Dehalococcoidia bacterium]|nr:CAP domain-containing protein [Dehalococcoidia bacterium]